MKGYQQTSMNLMLDNTVSEEGDNSLKQREKNSVKTEENQSNRDMLLNKLVSGSELLNYSVTENKLMIKICDLWIFIFFWIYMSGSIVNPQDTLFC